MTPAQDRLYWRLWSEVRKADPKADRKAMHAAPSALWPQGLPASHKDWGTREELDEWIARCQAITQPASFVAQQRQVAMPAARERVYIGHLLTALGRPESYAEAIVARMNRGARSEYSGAGSGALLETLTASRARDVVIALKQECRRVWATKASLLGAIDGVCREHDLDEDAAREAAMQALNTETLGRGIDTMNYDDLLTVLSALRTLAGQPARVPGAKELEGVDVPF